jgi:Ribbon-helix-helix protein, copG family
MMLMYMQRTQIYITAEQERRIAARAADAGVSKAEVIRRLLDQGLGLDDGTAERRRLIESTAGIAPDADGWETWLHRVRGDGAGARLEQLGHDPAV